MNIVFLSKLKYMSKNLIKDRYGRLYEIPTQLDAKGHNILCCTLDYSLTSPLSSAAITDKLTWNSYNLIGLLSGLYLFKVMRLLKKSDVLIVSSDCLHVGLGYLLTLFTSKVLIVDCYDNYESFGMSKIPGLKWLYIKGIQAADLISTVSDELGQHLHHRYQPKGDIFTVESTITPGQFFPNNKKDSRDKLGLSYSASQIVFGLSGGLNAERGIPYIYQAITELADEGVNIQLCLAGNPSADAPIPQHPAIRYIGALTFEQMNDFYNAVDCNIIQIVDSSFGSYCFPQKLYEILATQSPLIASNVGALKRVFSDQKHLLYKGNNVESIKQAISNSISTPVQKAKHIPSWSEVIDILSNKIVHLKKQSIPPKK